MTGASLCYRPLHIAFTLHVSPASRWLRRNCSAAMPPARSFISARADTLAGPPGHRPRAAAVFPIGKIVDYFRLK